MLLIASLLAEQLLPRILLAHLLWLEDWCGIKVLLEETRIALVSCFITCRLHFFQETVFLKCKAPSYAMAHELKNLYY